MLTLLWLIELGKLDGISEIRYLVQHFDITKPTWCGQNLEWILDWTSLKFKNVMYKKWYIFITQSVYSGQHILVCCSSTNVI